MHYCMNKFAGYSFSTEKKSKCGKCGMKTNGCCKDEKKQMKLSPDQQKSTTASSISLNFTPALIHSFIYNSNKVNVVKSIVFSYGHMPTFIPKQGLQAFYAIFLI